MPFASAARYDVDVGKWPTLGWKAGRSPRKESHVALKPSEYGGSDTRKTQGIQPAPHQVTQTEHLRLMYATDPTSVDEPDALAPKHTTPTGVPAPPKIQDL